MANVLLRSTGNISLLTGRTDNPRTVKPLDNVVLSVVMVWLIGVAKPRFIGCKDLRAARLLSAWFKLRASRREAMAYE